MRWIDKARDVAKEYERNCIELRQLEEYMETASTGADGPRVMNGKISKPVEIAVEKKMSLARYEYLKQATSAVELAMQEVSKKPQGNLTIKLFDMVYRHRSHTLYGAAQVIGVGEATAKRYNRFLLKSVAVQMGFIKFLES